MERAEVYTLTFNNESEDESKIIKQYVRIICESSYQVSRTNEGLCIVSFMIRLLVELVRVPRTSGELLFSATICGKL